MATLVIVNASTAGACTLETLFLSGEEFGTDLDFALDDLEPGESQEISIPGGIWDVIVHSGGGSCDNWSEFDVSVPAGQATTVAVVVRPIG